MFTEDIKTSDGFEYSHSSLHTLKKKRENFQKEAYVVLFDLYFETIKLCNKLYVIISINILNLSPVIEEVYWEVSFGHAHKITL